MASGDTVFEADAVTVFKNVAGKGAGLTSISGAGNGYRVGLGGTISGAEVSINDLVVVANSGSISSPFDPTKTYDVIIKEH